MLGRLHHLIVDCPDPMALARFYAALLGQPITYESDDFVVVADATPPPGSGSSGLAIIDLRRGPIRPSRNRCTST